MTKDERTSPANINFPPSKEMAAYLQDIVEAGGYGNTPTSVVKQMAWDAIRTLVKEGWIDRRNGSEEVD